MKKLNSPFLRNRTSYFIVRVVVSIGLLATMAFVIARTDSPSKAQGSCTTDPVVANNLDSGAGSLRQAIADACAGSTITFNMATATSPISLTSAELLVNKNLTITGPGASSLTVQRSSAGGTPDFRIFNINGGVTVSISGLTLSNGRISGSFPGNYGGAIRNNHSTLTITDCTISGNHAVQVVPAGFGGGIFNDGANGGSATLNILNSQITGNSATGNGGGIFNWGSFGNASVNITLNQGELPSSVVVNLVDGNNQTHDVPAEDVRVVPNSAFTQVVFRLPDTLASGLCQATIKAQGRTSNTGTIRIAP